jgi:hypothetical protein
VSDPTTRPPYDGWRPNPLVDEAERQLRAFVGEHVDRATAARFLASWKHHRELTADDVSTVLDRFGPDERWTVHGREAP